MDIYVQAFVRTSCSRSQSGPPPDTPFAGGNPVPLRLQIAVLARPWWCIQSSYGRSNLTPKVEAWWPDTATAARTLSDPRPARALAARSGASLEAGSPISVQESGCFSPTPIGAHSNFTPIGRPASISPRRGHRPERDRHVLGDGEIAWSGPPAFATSISD